MASKSQLKRISSQVGEKLYTKEDIKKLLTEVSKHRLVTEYDNNGELYSANCLCGKVFPTHISYRKPETYIGTWVIEWEEHIRTLDIDTMKG